MRYLNFYLKPVIRDGECEVHYAVGVLEGDAANMPDHPSIRPIAIFDTSTTPPTFVKSWENFGLLVGRHPKFPTMHIDPFGNICRSVDHKIVMLGVAP